MAEKLLFGNERSLEDLFPALKQPIHPKLHASRHDSIEAGVSRFRRSLQNGGVPVVSLKTPKTGTLKKETESGDHANLYLPWVWPETSAHY